MEPTPSNVKNVIEKSLHCVLPDSERNLFQLGYLDSLLSVKLIVELEKIFHVKLSALDFADDANFTVKNLADIIQRNVHPN